ncbi:hypothetical protein J437_LFUL014776 [Ladona fulva]|uniref:WIF domain-containing protein n=1 Tax=Ladona fulva TaxID=123851 RepID=A0A8K0P533_LADFU|nr:hypothetical protein J437_LFUL014776 [Ladona fulva]
MAGSFVERIASKHGRLQMMPDNSGFHVSDDCPRFQEIRIEAAVETTVNLWERIYFHGLDRELFYVRDGVINEYALNFVVPVPSNINHLHFTWQSLTGKPAFSVTCNKILKASGSLELFVYDPRELLFFGGNGKTWIQLPYALGVEVSDPAALSPPAFNVSLTGGVPIAPQTFMVALPCSGALDAEVNVTLRLNVTLSPRGSPKNATSLVFKRKKICLKGEKGFMFVVCSGRNLLSEPGLL